jgi:uncharacterized protein YdaU (DUF1376 family)
VAEFPALPLFTDAYLADTEHLSDAEHGIYLKLLMVMWRSPNCRIPNDDDWIARRMRRTAAEVVKTVRPIISEFCQCDGNWITQKRLLKELEWCLSKRKQTSGAAKSRWEKEKHTSGRNAVSHNGRNAVSHDLRNAPYPTRPHQVRGLSEEGSKEDSEERSSGRPDFQNGEF